MNKVCAVLGLWLTLSASAFQPFLPTTEKQVKVTSRQVLSACSRDNENGRKIDRSMMSDRRSMLSSSTRAIFATALIASSSSSCANAAVGSLSEFSDTNAILQGVTVDVADLSQQDSMIAFLQGGLNFKVLRQRRVGSVTDTWMGFGPEQLSIPENFELPVSSFATYGGHASIHIRYDSQTTDVFYKQGENAPGDNIAYLQVGVPEYRISQMVKEGGNVLDAYGKVEVISPAGLPIRALIGISADPIMLLALNCPNVNESRAFYEGLGFTEQEFPYCRPNKGQGQFEPPQPKGSVYLAPSKNSMGVLLLKAPKKKVKTNLTFSSMNIVYTPSDEADSSSASMKVTDPYAVPVSFIPVNAFEKEEKTTRVLSDV